jgi:hypothetical protein
MTRATASAASSHIGRWQSGPAAAEHRIDWKLAKELEDGGEKRVIRSEHHSRADEKASVIVRRDRRRFLKCE